MFTRRRSSRAALNSTVPAMSAKSVWSLPTPTLLPGSTFVPRWRTMIVPASTRAPAYSFTPSRCPALSRPLRVEPAPFLCAISLSLDLGDAERRLVLPVAACFPRPCLVLVLEYPDLRTSSMPDDLRRHDRVGHERGAGADTNAVGEEQHLVEDDRIPGVAREALEEGDVGEEYDDEGRHPGIHTPEDQVVRPRKHRRAVGGESDQEREIEIRHHADKERVVESDRD